MIPVWQQGVQNPDMVPVEAESTPSNGVSKKDLHSRSADSDDASLHQDDGHLPDCARLKDTVLQGSWWEKFRCDQACTEEAACLVVPPVNNEASPKPAPVILFLTGNGHVNDRQDFFWGGVDLLLRNPRVRAECFVVVPKPTTRNGLLRYKEDWSRTWAEDATWALFTEVLRRLGSLAVDARRLYVTGISLGAAGTWHLALRFGEHLAAVMPISGHCEWPGDSWPRGTSVKEPVLKRLTGLPMYIYQIDVDYRAGSPIRDVEWLCWGLDEQKREVRLPGMDLGKTCDVHIRRWCWHEGLIPWELWVAQGPLKDWSSWDVWGGDNHCLWQRVYPGLEWGFPQCLLQHQTPQHTWQFGSPPVIVDTSEQKRELETAWYTPTEGKASKVPRQDVAEAADST